MYDVVLDPYIDGCNDEAGINERDLSVRSWHRITTRCVALFIRQTTACVGCSRREFVSELDAIV